MAFFSSTCVILFLFIANFVEVRGQCREVSLQSIEDEVNSEPLSYSEKRKIIDVAYRLYAEVNPHRQLQITKLKVNPLKLLDSLRMKAAPLSNFEFHSHMIHIFSKTNDLSTFYTAPAAFGRLYSTLGFWLRPYWLSGANRPKFTVASNDFVLNEIPDDMPQGSQILAIDGKDPTILARQLGEEGYAGTEASRLWEGGFMLTRRRLSHDPLPSKSTSTFYYTHPNGTNHFLTLAFKIADCRPLETDDSSRLRANPNSVKQTDSSYPCMSKSVAGSSEAEAWSSAEWELIQGSVGCEKDASARLVNAKRAKPMKETSGRQAKHVEPFYNFSFDRIPLSDSLSWFVFTVNTELGTLNSLFPLDLGVELSAEQRQTISDYFAQFPADARFALDIRGNSEITRTSFENARFLSQVLTGKDLPQVPVHVLASETTYSMAKAGNEEGILRLHASLGIIHALKAGERYCNPYGDIFSATNLITDRPDTMTERAYFNKLAIVTTTSTGQLYEMMVALMKDSGAASFVLSINGRTTGNIPSVVSFSELKEQYPEIWYEELPEGIEMSTSWNRMYRQGDRAGEDIQYTGVKPDEVYYFTFEDATAMFWEGIDRSVLRWFNKQD